MAATDRRHPALYFCLAPSTRRSRTGPRTRFAGSVQRPLVLLGQHLGVPGDAQYRGQLPEFLEHPGVVGRPDSSDRAGCGSCGWSPASDAPNPTRRRAPPGPSSSSASTCSATARCTGSAGARRPLGRRRHRAPGPASSRIHAGAAPASSSRLDSRSSSLGRAPSLDQFQLPFPPPCGSLVRAQRRRRHLVIAELGDSGAVGAVEHVDDALRRDTRHRPQWPVPHDRQHDIADLVGHRIDRPAQRAPRYGRRGRQAA